MSIDVEALRTGLHREQRELQAAVATDEQSLREQEDEGVRAALELRQSQLRKVEHALERHEAGTWQECEDCGKPLTEEQFRAVPTTTHCTDCAGDHVYWGDTRVINKDDLGL